jgi:hypothetical protein
MTALPAEAWWGEARPWRKVPSAWDFQTWADDLDRAVVALSRQDFTTSTMLTGRWPARFPGRRQDWAGAGTRIVIMSFGRP